MSDPVELAKQVKQHGWALGPVANALADAVLAQPKYEQVTQVTWRDGRPPLYRRVER